MARKRSRNNPLLWDHWELVLILAIATALAVGDWVVRSVIIVGLLIAAVIYYAWYKRKLTFTQALGIEDMDAMSGEQFEQRIWMLFKDLGYAAELTKTSGDFGGDIIVTKNGLRTVVQAKRYKSGVGVEAVQEALAAKAIYRCVQALVVTNSSFTPQAKKLALHNNVELWDREKLIEQLTRTMRGKGSIIDES